MLKKNGLTAAGFIPMATDALRQPAGRGFAARESTARLVITYLSTMSIARLGVTALLQHVSACPALWICGLVLLLFTGSSPCNW